MKFSGCYARIGQSPRSGSNLIDIIRDAKALYKAEHKKKREFRSELAWEVLRHKTKWSPVPPFSNSSSVADHEHCSTRASSPICPLGKKSCKRIRLSEAKREREEDDEALDAAKAQVQSIQERRISAMEEANRLANAMQITEIMSKEMEILNQDESKLNEVSKKILKKMQAKILLKYKENEAEGSNDV